MLGLPDIRVYEYRTSQRSVSSAQRFACTRFRSRLGLKKVSEIFITGGDFVGRWVVSQRGFFGGVAFLGEGRFFVKPSWAVERQDVLG